MNTVKQTAQNKNSFIIASLKQLYTNVNRPQYSAEYCWWLLRWLLISVVHSMIGYLSTAGLLAYISVILLCIDKTTKRNGVGGQTSNPSSVKPLRKIAPGSSSGSSATRIPLRRDSKSKLSPAAGRIVELGMTATLSSAKAASDSVTLRHSVSRVHSTAVGSGDGTPLTLVNAHKPSIASKSGWLIIRAGKN